MCIRDRYKGVFAQPNLAGTISKDLLFEGTFYHLWYLPAVLLGVIVLLCLIRFNSAKLTAVMVSVLYLIGLFGDSYYGLAAKIPLVKGLYDPLFTLFGHTRNGLFFAPMFLFLGWMFSRYSPRFSKRFGTVGLCTSTVLLLLEGIVLHAAKLPRHDSMYVMPVSYTHLV